MHLMIWWSKVVKQKVIQKLLYKYLHVYFSRTRPLVWKVRHLKTIKSNKRMAYCARTVTICVHLHIIQYD